MLQIPTEVIRNVNFIIDEKTFTVYAYLLYVKFRSYSNEIEVDHNNLKRRTNITDNRTLRRCLDKLYDNKLISEKVEKFPIKKKLPITLLDTCDMNWFTQLPMDIFYDLDEIGYVGFRLLFYYESFINRKKVTQLFSFPSYVNIKEDLNICNDSISKYNSILSNKKYITITKHEAEIDDFLDDGRFVRYNNHYRVNIDRMVKNKK